MNLRGGERPVDRALGLRDLRRVRGPAVVLRRLDGAPVRELLDDLALRSFDELERALKKGGFLVKYLDRVLPPGLPGQTPMDRWFNFNLAELGLGESPQVGEVLDELRRRKLRGDLDGRESELAAARELIGG